MRTSSKWKYPKTENGIRVLGRGNRGFSSPFVCEIAQALGRHEKSALRTLPRIASPSLHCVRDCVCVLVCSLYNRVNLLATACFSQIDCGDRMLLPFQAATVAAQGDCDRKEALLTDTTTTTTQTGVKKCLE